MENGKYWGLALASLFMASIIGTGYIVPGMFTKYEKVEYEKGEYAENQGMFKNFLKEDQINSRKIVDRSRTLDADRQFIERQLAKLPRFSVPKDRHITQTHIDKYLQVVHKVRSDFDKFKKEKIGKRPSMYSVLALYGMADNYIGFLINKALVENDITSKQFNWTRDEIFMAALFCMNDRLQKPDISEEEIKRINEMQTQMYLHLKAGDFNDDGFVPEPEKVNLAKVPKHNISMFLKNKKIIIYQKVNFMKPIEIQFDYQSILAAAANNPE